MWQAADGNFGKDCVIAHFACQSNLVCNRSTAAVLGFSRKQLLQPATSEVELSKRLRVGTGLEEREPRIQLFSICATASRFANCACSTRCTRATEVHETHSNATCDWTTSHVAFESAERLETCAGAANFHRESTKQTAFEARGWVEPGKYTCPRGSPELPSLSCSKAVVSASGGSASQ